MLLYKLLCARQLISQICAIGLYIVLITNITLGGLGRHQQYVVNSKALPLQLRLDIAINDLYIWSVAFVKISLACMLLRIQFQRTWRISLYILIGTIVLFSTSCSLLNWLQCRPLRARWDYSFSRDHCFAAKLLPDWMYGASCMFMIFAGP
jgi:hypothetical protein